MRCRILLLSALITSVCASGALACGYHHGLANSTLEAVHPKSLSVAVAIRRAVNRGALENSSKTTALPTFAGGEYRQAVRQLRGLEEKLARIAPRFQAEESWRFAFVFVRSRLWAQYTIRPDGASAIVHAPAAGDGETTVLSDESVLNAILEARLAFDDAVDQGLLQFANDRDGKVLHILRAALTAA